MKAQQTAAAGDERSTVICAIRKGGHIGADKPIASGTMYELMPHDARHTLVTNLLEKNVPLCINLEGELGVDDKLYLAAAEVPVIDVRVRRN